MARILAVVARESEGVRALRIEDGVDSFHRTIGCDWFECYSLPFGGRRYAVYCDELGLVKGLAPTVVSPSGRAVIRGTAVVTAVSRGEDVSMSPEEASSVCGTARLVAGRWGSRRVLVCDSEPPWADFEPGVAEASRKPFETI